MKIGFIIDSSAGLTKKEANDNGFGYLPLPITINGKEYLDGVDVSPEEILKKLTPEDKVKTSATPPKIIEDVFKEYSKKYDQVIVYAISKNISSQTSNLKVFSREYQNIHVVESKLVSFAIIDEIKNIQKFAKGKKTIDEIMRYANEQSPKYIGVLIPKRLDWLVKGGRVGPKVAAMANLLRIVPVLGFENGSLVKQGKGKIFAKTSVKVAKKIKAQSSSDRYIIATGQKPELKELAKKIKEELGEKNTLIKPFPSVIALHTGEESIIILSKNE